MKTPSRRSLLLLVAGLPLLAACQAVAGGHSPPSPPAPPPLVVASDLDNPPFAWVDEQGRPAGRDVEMMEAIGRLLGRPVEWRRIPFETLLPAAQAGLVDVVCATLGVSPERAEKVAFSRPYFETVIALVVRSGPGEPRGWDELSGLRVAAAPGTTAERAVAELLPRSRGVFEGSKAPAAERLLLGEVDAIAMDGPAADALVAASGGALTTLHTPLAPERYALALPRDRPELLAAVDAALAQLQASGELSRWNGSYGLRPTRAP